MTNPLDAAGSPAELFSALFGLAGEVAVITGAAGALGREMSRMFAIAGAAVVVADLDLPRAEEVAATIRDKGGRALAVALDVTEEAQIVSLFLRVRQEFGGVSILVNNAGIFPVRPLVDMSVSEWDKVLDLNLRGTFICTREAVRSMKATGKRGRVVNISSIASLHPVLQGYAHYGASKGGINMFTKEVALEVAEYGINVNALLIGGVSSPGRKPGAVSTVKGPATQPGRFLLGAADPWRHAVGALFLAGPGASHMTGELLVADGGFLVT
jgi:NAD(P)-dependent dehydrogenase (short-subunit alcohol dehydrogenase family)